MDDVCRLCIYALTISSFFVFSQLFHVLGLWNGRGHDVALVHAQDLWDHQGGLIKKKKKQCGVET
jgi:hypothetical protein